MKIRKYIKWSFEIQVNILININILLKTFHQVCCLLLDAMFSTCSYDIKLDPVTGKYLGSFKVTATKDFVSDGSQTHEVSFNPIVSFNHPVWSNYSVHPIHVSNFMKKDVSFK